MPKCSIGTCELGSVPRTVAIIDRPLWAEDIVQLQEIGTDILEIRADSFTQDIQSTCAFIAEIKKACSLPLIGTIRENTGNSDKRLEFFKSIIPLVDAIDIELDNSITAEVIRMAAGRTIIVSEHDFQGTPDNNALQGIVEKALTLGGHIIKIAVLAKNQEDVVRLLQFVHGCTANIVAFSMGEYGTISRVMSMLFGSLFSYGFVT
ncbi:MAG: type I 3-dehydroquinate dehydratase, partial [Chitinivibrionales bacterium]